MQRPPNGMLADLRTDWLVGKPQYDPGNINVPTLLIHAECDADLPSYQAPAYFTRLTHAPYKRFIELGEGDAYNHHGEKPHAVLREVSNCLNEVDPLALQ